MTEIAPEQKSSRETYNELVEYSDMSDVRKEILWQFIEEEIRFAKKEAWQDGFQEATTLYNNIIKIIRDDI